MAIGDRKINDKINGELLEGKCSIGLNGCKQGNSGMSVNLILLTDCTAVDDVFDKGGETRPPEVTFKDRFHAENAHMTGCRGEID